MYSFSSHRIKDKAFQRKVLNNTVGINHDGLCFAKSFDSEDDETTSSCRFHIETDRPGDSTVIFKHEIEVESEELFVTMPNGDIRSGNFKDEEDFLSIDPNFIQTESCIGTNKRPTVDVFENTALEDESSKHPLQAPEPQVTKLNKSHVLKTKKRSVLKHVNCPLKKPLSRHLSFSCLWCIFVSEGNLSKLYKHTKVHHALKLQSFGGLSAVYGHYKTAMKAANKQNIVCVICERLKNFS